MVDSDERLALMLEEYQASISTKHGELSALEKEHDDYDMDLLALERKTSSLLTRVGQLQAEADVRCLQI
jgi:hypothetical protein